MLNSQRVSQCLMRHKMTYNTQKEKCIFVIKFLHLATGDLRM